MNKNEDFRVKLIYPCVFEQADESPFVKNIPYGMCVIAAFLKKNNFYVEEEDLHINFNCHRSLFFPQLNLRDEISLSYYIKGLHAILRAGNFKSQLGSIIDSLLDTISLKGFNLIGFSCFTFKHFLFALAFSRRIKQNFNIPVVLGGAFITLYGHLYHWAFYNVDYMIIGDGGVPLLKLIDCLNNNIAVSEVPNLVYKESGQIKTNPRIYYPIEEIPIPDFDGLRLDSYSEDKINYQAILPYQLTRGCVNKCSFCVYSCINNKIEFKSYEKVIFELRQMKEKYRSRFFRFTDDEINNSYEYLENLCSIFIKNKLDTRWGAFAGVGNLDKHLLRKMKKAGCWWLAFGIESGSNAILKRMHKRFTAEEASQTLKYAAEAGIGVNVNFMTGFPGETQEDIEQTMNFIERNKRYIHVVAHNKFLLYHGSQIHLNPEKYGVTNLIPLERLYIIKFDDSSGLTWEQKQKQQEYSYEQIEKAVNEHIKSYNFNKL